MTAMDAEYVVLPNGTRMSRETRENGHAYIVNGDPDVRTALPSVSSVMSVIRVGVDSDIKTTTGIDGLMRALNESFRKNYLTHFGTPPQEAKAFSSMYAQAREWARQGHQPELIDETCRNLNATQFVNPLTDYQMVDLLKSAINTGMAENYEQFIASAIENLATVVRDAASRAGRENSSAGQRVRAYVENDLLGEALPEVTPDIEQAVAAWKDWKSAEELTETVAINQPLYHPDGFAGAVDAIVRVKTGELRMIVWETESRMHDRLGIPIGAYARGWEYVSGRHTATGIVIRLDKDTGIPQPSPWISIPRAWAAFDAALRFHQVQERMHLVWQSGADYK